MTIELTRPVGPVAYPNSPRAHPYRLHNGHPAINPESAALVLDFVDRLGRPTTVREMASVIPLSRNYIRSLVRWMADEQMIHRVQVGNYGKPTLYSARRELDTVDLQEPTKSCPKCARTLPLSDFQRDSSTATGRHSRCRLCRSPLADKSKVKVIPGRGVLPGQPRGGGDHARKH